MKLSEVQYRLWAQMLVTGVHSSRENPPQVPMITGSTPRRKPQNKDFQESIVSTAQLLSKQLHIILLILPQFNHPKFSRQSMNIQRLQAVVTINES